MIGNVWLDWGNGEDTGEPFFFWWTDDGWLYYFKEPGKHEVSVATSSPVYKTLPEEFLAESVLRPDYSLEVPTAVGYIKNRPCYYAGVKIEGSNVVIAKSTDTAINSEPHSYDFIPGETYFIEATYVVLWRNGHQQTIHDSYETYGNNQGLWMKGSYENETNTSERISIGRLYNSSYTGEQRGCLTVSSYAGGSGTVTIVSAKVHAYHVKKLDEIMIPDTIQRVGNDLYLNDSAGAKWKLIVGTDGTLSTEAVTE